MADLSSVVEEKVKFKDGKKWKPRWCVIRKPSPVADRLQVQLYKCIKDAIKGDNPKSEFYLEVFYGLETGFSYDKENNVLAIICQKQVTVFAFDSRETLIKFEIKIRNAIGEENQFHIYLKRVPPNSKLSLEKMRLHIHGQKFCLTKHTPPRILASWNISDLRRFGKVEGKFVFEGGSRCGKVSGVHVLQSDQIDDIEEIVQLASQGKTISCRKANKRRSQNCDYLDPVTRSPSLYKNHLFYYQNEQQSRGWRHSISTATDTSWSSSYNSQLMSIENLQREKRAMQIYDVPSRLIRKVQRIQSPSNCRDDTKEENSLLKNNADSVANMHNSSTSLNISGCEGNAAGCLGVTSSVSASAPALCGYGAYSPFSDDYKHISCSVPDRIDEEIDHQEALESLQRQELDLQREISLLDELLQGCQRDDSSKHGRTKRDKCKPPPIPRKSPKINKRPDNIPIPHTPPHLRMEQSLLSPNLVAKLKKIPSNSKLSAPLPYVNLDKYDIGDVDNSHVHMSSPGANIDSGTWSAPCDPRGRHSRGRRFDPDKENIQKSLHHSKNNQASHCLQGKSSSESELSCRSEGYVQEDNIYENTPGQKNSPPSPPALPPKGPALLRKIQEGTLNALSNCREEAPPIPPHESRKSRGQGNNASNYQYVVQGVRPVPRRPDKHIGPVDSYLLMSSFQKEDERSSSVQEVKLPTRRSVGKSEKSPGAAYMEMGSFQDEKDENVEQDSAPPLGKRQHYARSLSTSAVLDDNDTSSISDRSQSCASSNTSLIREENYLLMSNFQKKSLLSSSNQTSQSKFHTSVDMIPQGSTDRINTADVSFSSTSSEICEPAAIPFPNLINFQRHASIGITSTRFSRASVNNGSPNAAPSSDKNNSSESSGRKFLTRLIRRNSGNRKSMSQSQENLLQSSSSESCLERTLNQGSKEAVMNRVLSQSSDSSSSSCGPYPSKKDSSPTALKERSRSSSFPNRASFLEMTPPADKEQTSQHGGVRKSFYSELSLDDEMQLLDCDNSFEGSDSSSLNETGKGKTQSFYMGPCESTGSENGEDDLCHSEKDAQKLLFSKNHSKLKKTSDSAVFTALQFDRAKYQENLSDSSSKTDDEKLLDLMKLKTKNHVYSKESPEKYQRNIGVTDSKRRLSLPTDTAKSKSPKEEASEIAKLVTALTPFVPPKAKNFPSPLSPVPESTSSLSRVSDVSSLHSTSSFTSKDVQGRRKYDPVSQKEFAKANLRIQTIPTVEEEESIWVHRDSAGSQDAHTCEANGEQEEKFRALVVEVDEERDQDDTISLSSIDSSLTSNDEGVRSSPASTLLRPRSGKEYKMVERRRTTNDSLSSSPAQTPQSPSGGSVFTFETSCSPSQTSVFSPERESPNVPKFARTDSMMSKLYERISPPRSYMNVDMTPPSSPLCSTSISLPPEQLEPQLNYAEIDLTPVPSRSMRKSRKASQKSLKSSSTIEYAMIDMEATVAIQRAGREHAMSREDSLRRSDSRKMSLSSNREQKLSFGETSGSPETSFPPNEEAPTSLAGDSSPQPDVQRCESSSPEGIVGDSVLLPERKDDTTSSSGSEDDDDDDEE